MKKLLILLLFMTSCADVSTTFVPTFEEKPITEAPPYMSITYSPYKLSINNLGQLYDCNINYIVKGNNYSNTSRKYLNIISDTLKLDVDSLKWGEYHLELTILHSKGRMLINTNFFIV